MNVGYVTTVAVGFLVIGLLAWLALSGAGPDLCQVWRDGECVVDLPRDRSFF